MREVEDGKPDSPMALEAVLRLDAMFDVERAISGHSPEKRRTMRQEKSKSIFEDLHAWLLRDRETLSRSAEILMPIEYMLERAAGMIFSAASTMAASGSPTMPQPASSQYGGRLQIGMAAAIKSESVAELDQNSHHRIVCGLDSACFVAM